MEKIISRPSHLFFASRLCSLPGQLGQSPSNGRLTTVILSFVTRISSFDKLIIYDSTTLCDIVTPSALTKAAWTSRAKNNTYVVLVKSSPLEGKTKAQRGLGCKVS